MDLHSLVHALDLAPHPEGGFYRETFRSRTVVDAQRSAGPRAAATQILYALGAGEHSAWHRVRADELWQHHAGGVLDLFVILDGRLTRTRLGDVRQGHAPQGIVPHGAWQAARVPSPSPGATPWALCGCTVAPGFTFDDFELADQAVVDALAESMPSEEEARQARQLGPSYTFP